MNFTLDGLKEFRTDAELCKTNTEDREVLSDKMKFVYLQLPLFTKTENECKTNFDRWIFIFKNMATLEYIPWATKDTIFSQLGRFAQIANLSEPQRRKYDKDLKIYRDNINVLDYAVKSGIEKGRKEGEKIGIEKGEKIGIEKGRNEQLVESIKKFIAKGFDFDEVVKILEVSVDQIEELRRLVLDNGMI